MENIVGTPVFKLKGRLFTFTVLQIVAQDKTRFKEQLSAAIQKAPKLFDKTPLVFDSTLFSELDLAWYCREVREQGLIPVAVQGGGPSVHQEALRQGLALMHAAATQDKDCLTKDHEGESKAKISSNPLRSGQQLVAKGADLIVTAPVSHGAELLADGNIHVYGALRGRALAGISGDKQARIFCQLLDAELVSIAGFYRLRDAIVPPEGPCQIYLKDEHIVIEPL